MNCGAGCTDMYKDVIAFGAYSSSRSHHSTQFIGGELVNATCVSEHMFPMSFLSYGVCPQMKSLSEASKQISLKHDHILFSVAKGQTNTYSNSIC